MEALVLALLSLAQTMASQDGQWCWKEAEGPVTQYRIYTSTVPDPVCWGDPWAIGAGVCTWDGVCCDLGLMPLPEGDLVFFMVTGANETTEGPTGHGDVCPLPVPPPNWDVV